MGRDYFHFRLFTIRQHRCAMKVGTDGTLLGAWAQGGNSILDVGTGTGLVALMMAQRWPAAIVRAIDIDDLAVEQARENAGASPFADRIIVERQDVTAVGWGDDGSYDAIVCNPPFFSQSLQCPDGRRSIARHDDTLSYRQLLAASCRLLDDGGELSVVIPADQRQRMYAEAALAGMFICREWMVRTSPQKAPKRCLLAFRKHPPVAVEREELVMGSQRYIDMTKDFYLYEDNHTAD